AEAAKSRTPMVVLAADTGAAGARSNFALDQAGLAAAAGAAHERAATADSAVDDAIRAVRRARAERRTVVLSLPLDVQAGEATVPPSVVLPDEPLVAPAPAAVGQLADLLSGAQRPVFIAGRGARAAGPALADLADRCGARLATSAVAKGLFSGPSYLDETGLGRIDPRTLSIALDDLLPAARVVAVDSGNFMGYPSMYLSVPDERGFCFTQAFQSVGLGLSTAIGAALAQPERLPVAALGDGGYLMGI